MFDIYSYMNYEKLPEHIFYIRNKTDKYERNRFLCDFSETHSKITVFKSFCAGFDEKMKIFHHGSGGAGEFLGFQRCGEQMQSNY